MQQVPATLDYLATRVCPTCSGTRSRPRVRARLPAETLLWNDLREDWTGYFKEKTFFTYARCLDCGLLYNPVYFAETALNQLYGHMPDNTAGQDVSMLARTQERYWEFAQREGLPQGDYLELGPDAGLLIPSAIRHMSGAKLWLYEPNVAVHAELGRRANGRAHEIRIEMRDFSAVPDGTISLCVMIHVLDHLPDPLPVVRQLARKLRPDGRLLVVTHDERSTLARLLGRRWLAYCLQHPQLFNRHSTREFLRRSGLEVITTQKSVNYFPATYLLKHLLYALGLHAVKTWRWNAFTLPLKLGNIITAARLTH